MDMETLMIDELVANPFGYFQHRFVFDLQATNHVLWIIKDQQDTMFEQLEFAKPSYDKMYIELDVFLPRQNLSYKSGYIINNNHVIQIMQNGANDKSKAFMVPFLFNLNDKQLYGRDGKVVGGEDYFVMMNHLVLAFAALLILNRPLTHKVIRTDNTREILQGKTKQYMVRNEVTIDLKRDDSVRKEFFNTGTRGTYRRHEVRGTWVHYHKHPHCSHEYVVREVKIPDPDRPRYICSHCGQLRTWKPSFERGDASKGYATKQYRVTHSGMF